MQKVQQQKGKKNTYHTKTIGPSLTQQQFRDECNVNNIMAKYQKTGLIDHVNKHSPEYGDITSLDYHESMNTITTANSMFAELPAQIRKFFDNDPALFMDYVQDPENQENLYDMGLAERPHIPESKTTKEPSKHAGEEASETPPAASEKEEKTSKKE